MEDETTTNAPSDSGAVQTINGIPVDGSGNALPDTEETAAAESTTVGEAEASAETKPVTEDKPTEEPQGNEDELLATWAKNKGLELDSDNAKKAAKIARDNELAFKKKAQSASELEKKISTASDEAVEEAAAQSGQDPELLKRVQKMEVKANVRDFWDNHPEAREMEPQMIDELKRRPYLAGDLEALYAVVKNQDTSAAKREVLADLAHKQTAAVPRGNATNAQLLTGNERITPQNVDQLVGSHDLDWFKANQDAINAAMAG